MTVTGTCDCDDDRGFPLPTSESQRLKILRQTELLDSKEEESYDRYTSMAVRLFHVSGLRFSCFLFSFMIFVLGTLFFSESG